MVRPLTSAMVTEVQKTKIRPFMLVELDFSSGRIRLTDRAVDVTFAGNVFLGDGTLLGVSGLEETTQVRAGGTQIKLASTPTLRNTVLTDFYQGRRATVWLGFVNSSGAIVSDPEPIKGGLLEATTIDDDAAAPAIVINVESLLRDLQVPTERRWSNEDQKAEFPGDGGFRYVEAIQDFLLRAARL